MLEPTHMADPSSIPTSGQMELLLLIHRLTQEQGPPRISELNAELGLGPAGVRDRLLACEKKGFVAPSENGRRGPLRLTPLGRRWVKLK
jgi:Mn-dependent DtxR family transcriptional regulator